MAAARSLRNHCCTAHADPSRNQIIWNQLVKVRLGAANTGNSLRGHAMTSLPYCEALTWQCRQTRTSNGSADAGAVSYPSLSKFLYGVSPGNDVRWGHYRQRSRLTIPSVDSWLRRNGRRQSKSISSSLSNFQHLIGA